jgi:hypothetical protein
MRGCPTIQAFYFRRTNGSGVVAAHSVTEFHAALRSVAPASLRHHMLNGDFSRWAAEVLGNPELAHDLRIAERSVAVGASPDRDELAALIEEHFLLT